MTTSAYLLIRASEAVRHNGYVKALQDLWTLPEVKHVEPVSGLYDCVARVETPTRLVFLVHKIMTKSWVERVHVLRVDQPAQGELETEATQTARLQRQREIIKAHRAGLPRPPGPEPQLRAGSTGAEASLVARLKRQREIIKAYRVALPHTAGPELQLLAGPAGEEAALVARLKRQRKIIKAHYRKSGAADTVAIAA